ncbi:TrmH family RNA methyltransferase [Candidatus Kaiserbacteria bacterium]|nr:TrmH family RNA methyltransferase [Candidatus Kaiserbacteria bacterium]
MQYVILEDIRSAHNVGAIFRTADGAGVAKICLVGYTPLPTDRFGRVQSDIHKTSLGAADTVPWEWYIDSVSCIASLKKEGVAVVAVEQASEAIPYYTYKPSEHTAYVFGNEVTGVAKETLRVTDAIIDIPMYGAKESLNVATATGIVLFNAKAQTLPRS